MEQLIIDRLRDNLTRLNLNRASEVLQTIAEQAEADKRSYLCFLDQLLEEEVAVKEKRRFQTAMKTAGLPTAKSIDEYDFSFHPQLNKKEIMPPSTWSSSKSTRTSSSWGLPGWARPT